MRGVLKDGGSARQGAMQEAAQSIKGRLEAKYFAGGEGDVYLILDFPNEVNAAARALVVNASGAARTTSTPLLTLKEIDQAAKITAGTVRVDSRFSKSTSWGTAVRGAAPCNP